MFCLPAKEPHFKSSNNLKAHMHNIKLQKNITLGKRAGWAVLAGQDTGVNVGKLEGKVSELAAFVNCCGVSTKQSTTFREIIERSLDFIIIVRNVFEFEGPFHDIWRDWGGGKICQ